MMTIKDIRRAGVPLCGIESADPAATVKGILDALGVNGEGDKAEKAKQVPIIQWDIVSGLYGSNATGKKAIAWYDPLAMQLPEILKGFRDNPASGAIVILHGIGRFWDRDGVVQGLWLLRDSFKGCMATVVMLGPTLKLPAELQSDVVVMTEAPPNAKEIDGIIDRIFDSATKAGAKVDVETKPRVSNALRGLASAFDVEQTLSLSIRKDGVNVDEVWERKIKRIRSTTGMEIAIKNPDFKELAGCDNVKAELSAFINGRQKPGVVFFMDEIEKLFAGAGTDLSGVSTALVGLFLSWTSDRGAKGFLLPGVPGAGKTWTAHCTAGEAQVPFCKLSDIKAGIVGESEAKLRAALAAVDSLAGDGAVLMMASCNWVGNISPEILARFGMGQFFYDFPGAEDRKALWKMHVKKAELPKQAIPESSGWVGREIENCCWRARQFNRTLIEVAKNVCPAAVSQRARLDALRQECNGRFLSASTPGVYQYTEIERNGPGAESKPDRAMSFED